MSLQERQDELIATHRAIQDADLPYVLVGGWAVSAFQTRFTTDVDMVLPESQVAEYDDLLRDLGYEKTFGSDISNVYEGRIVRYEKPVGDNAVQFDALVGAMRCRQTDAEWSFRYLHEHSVVHSLEVAPELSGRIPEPALLFALKLHSGRRADTRDLVVISLQANFDRIERHLNRGNPGKLEERIDGVLERLADEGFEDSFKGVFQQQELPEDAVTDLRQFLESQLAKR
jgi:hypothetical protein